MVNYFDPHKPYSEVQVNGLPEKPLVVDQVNPFPFVGSSSDRMMTDMAGITIA